MVSASVQAGPVSIPELGGGRAFRITIGEDHHDFEMAM
jgi:hypothetical protein